MGKKSPKTQTHNPDSIVRSLHWLHVSTRINYKTLLLTHKCITGHTHIHKKVSLHKRPLAPSDPPAPPSPENQTLHHGLNRIWTLIKQARELSYLERLLSIKDE